MQGNVIKQQEKHKKKCRITVATMGPALWRWSLGQNCVSNPNGALYRKCYNSISNTIWHHGAQASVYFLWCPMLMLSLAFLPLLLHLPQSFPQAFQSFNNFKFKVTVSTIFTLTLYLFANSVAFFGYSIPYQLSCILLRLITSLSTLGARKQRCLLPSQDIPWISFMCWKSILVLPNMVLIKSLIEYNSFMFDDKNSISKLRSPLLPSFPSDVN